MTASTNLTALTPAPRITGSKSIPSRTGMTPTYVPKRAIKPKNATPGAGVATAARNFVFDDQPCGGEHRDEVRLSGDPRVVEGDRLGLESADGICSSYQIDECVVHGNLRDGHRVGAGVA